jgi:cytosine/adenosine deaminase-related metal-dependent hydrolase
MTANVRPVLFKDLRVFDGERVHSRSSVLVRGGLVAAVGTRLAASPDAEVISGEGRTLLPGLIDSHAHAFVPGALEQAIAFGVTTELDMFAAPEDYASKRARAAASDDMADLRSAGIGATAPGGHPSQFIKLGWFPRFPPSPRPRGPRHGSGTGSAKALTTSRSSPPRCRPNRACPTSTRTPCAP